MKFKHLLILAALSFILSNCGLSNKTILYFNDGTEKSGFGKIGTNNDVKFKTADSKVEYYGASDLKRVQIRIKDDVTFYTYLKLKSSGQLKIVEEVALGNVSLYQKVTQGNHAPMMGPNGGFVGGGGSYSISNYYVKKEDENEATHLGSTNLFSKNFKKAASAYFKDCSSLVQKLQDRTFKKRDLEKVIAFYNDECN